MNYRAPFIPFCYPHRARLSSPAFPKHREKGGKGKGLPGEAAGRGSSPGPPVVMARPSVFPSYVRLMGLCPAPLRVHLPPTPGPAARLPADLLRPRPGRQRRPPPRPPRRAARPAPLPRPSDSLSACISNAAGFGSGGGEEGGGGGEDSRRRERSPRATLNRVFCCAPYHLLSRF